MVRASLEAGSSDNVTCLVADVVADDTPDLSDEPLLVGAAADPRPAKQRGAMSGMTSLFRGHRAGDTGELEPIQAEILDPLPGGVPFAITTDPIDPEQARYAPRAPRRFLWLRRILGGLVLIGLVWIALAVAWSWSQDQYYVGEQDGYVIIYRGLNSEIAGFDLSEPYQTSDVEIDRLSEIEAERVREGIVYDNPVDAEAKVQDLAARQEPVESSGD
jgi:protein phosphatase